MINNIHIITLQIPLPLTNGANFELFYKLKALHNIGVNIHLHCYKKKQDTPQHTLLQYCSTVNYYNRSNAISLTKPYIVTSRNSKLLLTNLLANNYPILFDGLHTTALALHPLLQHQNMLIRVHNVEYLYYKGLINCTNNVLKKIYYLAEAYLLKKYEKKIATICKLSTFSYDDKKYFEIEYQAKQITYTPIFYASENITTNTIVEKYCLYHGNLAVTENEKIALWLCKNVIVKLPAYKFIIAGNNPTFHLTQTINNYPNCTLQKNLSHNAMQTLIANAHIAILPSINSTGVKLKIINSLYLGKYLITNNAGAAGITPKQLLTVCNTSCEYIQAITTLYNSNYNNANNSTKTLILNNHYNNSKNAEVLLKQIIE